MNSKLPYKKVKIKLKDFEHDKKYKKYKQLYGICNEGKGENEIWINKKLSNFPTDTIELTKLHELVHVRRQEAHEDGNGPYEEDVVELEAISRAKKKSLNMSQEIFKDFLTHTFKLNNKGKKVKIRLYPDKPEDLKEIHKKIKHILSYKYSK